MSLDELYKAFNAWAQAKDQPFATLRLYPCYDVDGEEVEVSVCADWLQYERNHILMNVPNIEDAIA